MHRKYLLLAGVLTRFSETMIYNKPGNVAFLLRNIIREYLRVKLDTFFTTRTMTAAFSKLQKFYTSTACNGIHYSYSWSYKYYRTFLGHGRMYCESRFDDWGKEATCNYMKPFLSNIMSVGNTFTSLFKTAVGDGVRRNAIQMDWRA